MEKYNDFIINVKNLHNNVSIIKDKIGEKVFLCAMVKANAYGHGVESICKNLKEKVEFFGVATVNEAREIRKFDKDTNILIVGLVLEKHYNWCAKNNVSVTADSINSLKNKKYNFLNNILKIHIKINTGLNRIGVNSKQEFLQLYNYIQSQSNMKVEGIFTHFATKSNDEKFIFEQHDKFETCLNLVNCDDVIVHCCNSYATDNFKHLHHDMVRCGFSIYGWSGNVNDKIEPKIIGRLENDVIDFVNEVDLENDVTNLEKTVVDLESGIIDLESGVVDLGNNYINLGNSVFDLVNDVVNSENGSVEYDLHKKSYLPVLQVVAKILSVHDISAGETVGYDRTHIVQSDTKIGVVSMGYADGFDRRNSNLSSVSVKGKMCRVVGNVCMDVFMVDLGKNSKAKKGDEVLILGRQGQVVISPQYHAKNLNTSPYEILLKLNYKRMNQRLIM